MDTIIWLYSGAISGWWCYDKHLNLKLNKMYINYCKQKMIDCSDFIMIDAKSYYDKTDDLVDFNSSATFDETSRYINACTIKTTHGDYNIDFNKMIQQNSHDASKKRSIKYIIIPQNIYENSQTLTKFFSENMIKGTSEGNVNCVQ